MVNYYEKWNEKTRKELTAMRPLLAGQTTIAQATKQAQLDAIDKLLLEHDELDAKRMQTPEDVVMSMKYMNKHKNAQSRNIEFTLTFNEFKRLFKRKTCFYTGVSFIENDTRFHLTIDRIDANQGYTKENCVACTAAANRIKNELFEHEYSSKLITPKQMLKMCKKILEK